MARTKKVGITGRFGARYGRKAKFNFTGDILNGKNKKSRYYWQIWC